jgi:hypothetical protein
MRQETPQLPGRPMWPNYPPGVPLPPTHVYTRYPPTYSRLPPDSVARKAPRKSSVSNTPTQSQQIPTRSSKPEQSHGSKQEYREKHKPEHTRQFRQDTRNDTPALDQDGSHKQRQIEGGEHRGLPRAPVRNRPFILDDDDEQDNGDDHVPMPSIEVDFTTDEELPIASTTPARTTRGQFRANLVRQRPRPRYQYTVPKGLKGVQLALGEDNWNDYVILVETRLLREISEMEFINDSKAIFLVFDVDTGAKIEELIANVMVMPVIREHAEEHRAIEAGVA